jgi:hypothetical protein
LCKIAKGGDAGSWPPFAPHSISHPSDSWRKFAQPRLSSPAPLWIEFQHVVQRQRCIAVCQGIEGVELHLVVMLAGAQSVKIRDAIDAEQNSLAIDYERDSTGCATPLRRLAGNGPSNRSRCG